jgi:hypothetical protein
MKADTLGEAAQRKMPTGYLLLLVFTVLLVPNVLMIESTSYIDGTRTSVILVAVLWSISHSYGSNIGGPFDRIDLTLLDATQLVWSSWVLVVSVFLFFSVRRFAIVGERKPFLQDVALTAFVLVVYAAILTYSLDAFLVHSGIPLPLLPVLGSVVVYFGYKRRS